MLQEDTVVHPGDELVLNVGRSWKLVKVAKVTPTGQIVLDNGDRYFSNGRKISGRRWDTGSLHEATPERRQETAREKQITFLQTIKWHTVDDDKLVMICAILERR